VIRARGARIGPRLKDARARVANKGGPARATERSARSSTAYPSTAWRVLAVACRTENKREAVERAKRGLGDDAKIRHGRRTNWPPNRPV